MSDDPYVPAEALDGMGRAVLDALFGRSPVGVHVLDRDLRVLRVNAAAHAMQPDPGAGLVGRRLTDAYLLEDAGAEEAVAREVLASGTARLDRLAQGRSPDGGTGGRVFSVSTFRIQEDGAPDGLVCTVADVTEREAARERARCLAAAQERMGHSLDLVATCAELADALVPAFADVAAVEVVEQVMRGDEPPLMPVPQDLPLRRAAFHGPLRPAYAPGEVRFIPQGTPFARVLADGRARVVPLEGHPAWLRAERDRTEALRAAGAHSMLVVPLTLRGAAFGILSLFRTASPGSFEDHDVTLVQEACAHAALCLDNARRYNREHSVATSIQRSLLPRRPPSGAALETANLHLPGTEGSGGWFDVIALPCGRTALVVGDVAGTDVHAATTMGQLRTAGRSLASLDLEPGEVLSRLSRTASVLARERSALPAGDPLHHEPLTASCVYAVWDPLFSEVVVARAGGPAPVLVRPDGSLEAVEVPEGPQLGGPPEPVPSVTVPVPYGSLLALCTPALAGDLAPGGGALCEALREGGRADADLDALCDEFAYLTGSSHHAGDALLLTARTRAFPSDRVAVRDLPDGPEAAGVARAHCTEQLEAWGVDEEVRFGSELIVSELVGNALRHGTPPLRLRLVLDRTLTCEVTDAGTSAPHLQHARASDEGGRGLFIVSQLCDQWGTRFVPGGKTVWAEQSLPSPG